MPAPLEEILPWADYRVRLLKVSSGGQLFEKEGNRRLRLGKDVPGRAVGKRLSSSIVSHADAHRMRRSGPLEMDRKKLEKLRARYAAAAPGPVAPSRIPQDHGQGVCRHRSPAQALRGRVHLARRPAARRRAAAGGPGRPRRGAGGGADGPGRHQPARRAAGPSRRARRGAHRALSPRPPPGAAGRDQGCRYRRCALPQPLQPGGQPAGHRGVLRQDCGGGRGPG